MTVWHPFTQHASEPPPLRIARTEGAALFTEDGRRVLDGIASWWVITHGHRHPHIMQAIRDATDRYDQIIFAGCTHEPAERLADALVALTPPGLNHVFFSDSGSTAVEVGLKMALGFHQGRRSKIAVMQHGYHGDTIGGMSVGARGVFNAAYADLLFSVATLPFPDQGDTLAHFETLCAAGDVAALILEPLILGAGGMLTYGPEILAGLKQIAERHGTLLIADEVMTGWGRTGTLFACEQAGIAPDILCTSKGLTGGAIPLAATLASNAVFAAHHGPRDRTLFHSSSFTANPIACAAALANIEIWRTEDVQGRIDALCATQAAHLARFANDARFSDVRRCGTITALDLCVGDAGYMAEIGPRLRGHFLQRDILLRPLGNTIYVLPPYCITDAELARIYDAVAEAADRFA